MTKEWQHICIHSGTLIKECLLFGHLSCVSMSIAWKDLPSKNFEFWHAWEKSNIRRSKLKATACITCSHQKVAFFEFQRSGLSKNEKRPQKQIKSEAQVTYYWQRAWKHSWLIINFKLWSTVKTCEQTHRVLKKAFLPTKMHKKRMFMRLTHRLDIETGELCCGLCELLWHCC